MSFIYVGRLDELKGIKVLFEAWKMMGESAPELIVCGIGPLEEWCKEYIKENQLTNIDMRGKVENTEAKKLIAQSEALILPTLWYEGFPMVIVEAYSAGTPVIGSDIGNVGCLIEDGVTGWKFEAGSPQDLSRLLKEKKPFSGLDIAKHYRDNYTEDVNYTKIKAIYESCIATKT